MSEGKREMKRFQSIAVAALVLVAALAAVLPAQPVSAQSSASLSIVPKKNYTIEPGKSVKDTITIRNIDAEKNLELNLRVIDFTFTDDGGTPKLFLAEDAPQTTWSLKPFLSVPKSVVIPPKSSKTLDIGVSIPATQGAGSYYSAIMYSSGVPDGGNVGLSASGVTLVFTSIPGEVNEKLTVEKFGAYFPKKAENGGNGYKLFTTEMPSNIAYTLKNEGNVTEAPVGSITVRNMFGKETVINNVNPNESLALVGQTRTFISCIKLKSQEVNFNGSKSEATTCSSPGLWPGLYTTSLELYYGQNGNRTQELVATSFFWYLPVWFIILVLVLLAVIAYFVWRFVRFFRQRFLGVPYKRGPQSSRRRRR